MDSVGAAGWGSSKSLLTHVYRTRPRLHLFGHLHEQRGEWRRASSGYEGGIEYRVRPDAPVFTTAGPPPKDYPCELVSCNAMANHPGLERCDRAYIAGPARLLLVEPRGAGRSRGDDGAVAASGGAARGDPSQARGRVLILNVAHRSFLGAPEGTADGQAVRMVPSGGSACLWDILTCPHEEGSVYLLHCATQRCLDTHGKGPVEVWNGGQTMDELVVGNVSKHAGNLRWKILPCEHEPGAHYIVNTRHGKFLDTHGRSVEVWNNNGHAVEDVIRGNTSRHAGNIRWILQPN